MRGISLFINENHSALSQGWVWYHHPQTEEIDAFPLFNTKNSFYPVFGDNKNICQKIYCNL